MKNFRELNLLPAIQKALDAMDFTEPTPIQAKAIPIALTGRDLIGCAQTGTGKTAAFCVPTLTRLAEKKGKTALVLAPTRELAQQIELFWKELTRFSKEMTCVNLMGGVSMGPQMRALRSHPRMIIATPGRLCDHLNRRTVDLGKTEVLILDEADRMLDMGFAPQLNEILRFLPKARQTLFFTATWDAKTDQLAKKYIHQQAEKITIGESSRAATTVSQFVFSVKGEDKNDILLQEFQTKEGSILVFIRTQRRTDRIAKFLSRYESAGDLTIGRIHGGRTQAQRTHALADFKSGKTRILLATDIAARGIDVAEIAHVINFDLPQVPEDYIHRIGRTGRAGATGSATSLVAGEEKNLWSEIVKLLKKTGSAVPQIKPFVLDKKNALTEKAPVVQSTVKAAGHAKDKAREQDSRAPQEHRGFGRRQSEKRQSEKNYSEKNHLEKNHAEKHQSAKKPIPQPRFSTSKTPKFIIQSQIKN